MSRLGGLYKIKLSSRRYRFFFVGGKRVYVFLIERKYLCMLSTFELKLELDIQIQYKSVVEIFCQLSIFLLIDGHLCQSINSTMLVHISQSPRAPARSAHSTCQVVPWILTKAQ